jgi:general secretion pathway protein A
MYNPYFGLRESPFNLTADARFFYANPIYQEVYAGLLYGVRQRKGLVVLTGEAGTGKTTLLKLLMHHAEATVRWIYVDQTIPTFDELLDFVCRQLGLLTQNAGRLQSIQTLHDFLLQQFQQGGTTVLVIDEAQHLGAEQLEHLRLLLNLETSTDKLLQMILVGQPALEKQLELPCLSQLKQRIALQRQLTRLTERDVGAYVYHRLRVAGYSQRRLFAPKAIQRIAQYSDGIPRLIHILCDNALLHAYGVSRKTVTAEMIDEVATDHRLAARQTAPAESQLPVRLRAGHAPREGGEVSKPRAVRHKRRRLAWAAGSVILLALGLIGARYSPQVWYRVSHLTLQVENLLEVVLQYLQRAL